MNGKLKYGLATHKNCYVATKPINQRLSGTENAHDIRVNQNNQVTKHQ